MAGSSPSPSDKLSAATQSPKVKTTEKKKRKRPSKKVPTTVLESSSTNFMDLVQKLTGSAVEAAAAITKPAPPSLAFSPALSLATSTTSSSPYSSPSCDYADPRMTSNCYYQQLLHNNTTTTTTTTEDDDSSSHGFANPNPLSSLYGDDDLYSSYSASSRATENDALTFSSSYSWFQPEMRA